MNLFNALDCQLNQFLNPVVHNHTNPSVLTGNVGGRLVYHSLNGKLGYWDSVGNTWRYLSETPTTVTSLPALDDTGDVDNPNSANKLEIVAGRVKNSHFSSAGADALALSKVGQGLTANKLIISLASGGSSAGLTEASNFQIDGSGNLEAINSKTFKAGRAPTASLEVATKGYVDTMANGYRDQKESCRYASVANIPNLAAVDLSQDGTPTFDTIGIGTISVTNGSATVTGTNTKFRQSFEANDKILIDSTGAGVWQEYTVQTVTSNTSITLTANFTGTTGSGRSYQTKPVAGDRVLVKDQTTLSQNGIYVLGTIDGYNVCALSRATDADGTNPETGKSELSGNAFTFVEEGATYADTMWTIVSAGEIVIGTDDIEWTQTAGANSITAGAGLTMTGNIIDINTASSSRIVVNADNIDLATVTPSDITSSVNTTDVRRATFDSYGRLSGSSASFLGSGATGLMTQTGANTYAGRTITGTSNRVTVTNGDGVSGNPTLTAPQDLHTSSLFQVGTLTIADSVVSGGRSSLTITVPSHTNITTEQNLLYFNASGATLNHTGAVTSQRFVYFRPPAVSGSTITNAATVAISGAPSGGTVTNRYALWIESGDLMVGGVIRAGSTPTTLTDSAGKILSAALNTVAVGQGGTGATSFTTNAVLYGNSTSAIQAAAVNATATPMFLKQVSSGAPAFAQLAFADISNAFPQSSYLVVGVDSSLTNERALVFNATNFSVSDAGAGGNYTVNTVQNIDSTATPTFARLTLSPAVVSGGATTLTLNHAAHTAITAERRALSSIGGTWTITGGYSTQYSHYFGAHIFNAATSQTITTAATVYISGGPTTSGSATITNKYALAIGAGLSWLGNQIFVRQESPTVPKYGLKLLAEDVQEEAYNSSDWLELEAAWTSSGPIPHRTAWKMQVEMLNNTGGNNLSFYNNVDGGSWTKLMWLNSAGQLYLGSYQMYFTVGANLGLFRAIGITTTRTWSLPDADGTVALTTNSTFGSGSTWNGNTIGVAYGGTGATSFTSKGVLYGNGTGAVQVSNVNATGTAMYLKQTSSGNPTFTQIAIADVSGGASTSTTITVAGTANQITSSAGAQDLSTNRTWTLSLPATLYAPGTISMSSLYIWTGSAGLGTAIIDTNLNIINAGNITTSANKMIGAGVTATSSFHALFTSATTNSAISMMKLDAQTSGTAANNFGGKIEFFAESSGGSSQIIGQLDFTWKNATTASRVGSLSFQVYNVTTAEPLLVLDGDGFATVAGTLRPDGDSSQDLGATGQRWNIIYGYSLDVASYVTLFGGGTTAGKLNIGANSTSRASINFTLGGTLTSSRTAGNLEAVSAGLYYTPNTTGGNATDRKKVALMHITTLGFGITGVSGFASDGATSTSVTVTHNLGTRDVAVWLRKVASPYDIVYLADFTAPTTETINIATGTALADDAWQCIIVG